MHHVHACHLISHCCGLRTLCQAIFTEHDIAARCHFNIGALTNRNQQCHLHQASVVDKRSPIRQSRPITRSGDPTWPSKSSDGRPSSRTVGTWLNRKHANFVLITKKKNKSKQFGQPRNDSGNPVVHHGWSGGRPMNLGLSTALHQMQYACESKWHAARLQFGPVSTHFMALSWWLPKWAWGQLRIWIHSILGRELVLAGSPLTNALGENRNFFYKTCLLNILLTQWLLCITVKICTYASLRHTLHYQSLWPNCCKTGSFRDIEAINGDSACSGPYGTSAWSCSMHEPTVDWDYIGVMWWSPAAKVFTHWLKPSIRGMRPTWRWLITENWKI